MAILIADTHARCRFFRYPVTRLGRLAVDEPFCKQAPWLDARRGDRNETDPGSVFFAGFS
jgi:hypothetical protein